MDFFTLLRRKRDRGRLTPQEFEWLINAFLKGEIPDYQMAAFLMAVYLQGLSLQETVALTSVIMNSGTVVDLSDIAGAKVDKHSTGGVGDKVSLILAPLVAACGVVVPMVSGRSLGHTGGTLDKLESIPGLRTDLKVDEFKRVLERVGVAIIGQTDEMCPADRRIYALRDVTGTVESIPLIASSIMAKKLAEGIDGLVLDVKTGAGAFMRRIRDARRLALLMVAIGKRFGKQVVAFITEMWQPLGVTVGNALEVKEAIEALRGSWTDDLKEVTFTLAEEMLLLANRAKSRVQARRQLLRALSTGRALEKFRQMIAAQGGDDRVVDDYTLLPIARVTREVFAERSGYIRAIDALAVGMLGLELGLGRKVLSDRVEHGTGFVFHKKVGARVAKGEVIAEVYASREIQAERVAARLARCFNYGESPPSVDRVVLERIVPVKHRRQRLTKVRERT